MILSAAYHYFTGMTMDRVIANVGEREFASGLTYTAVSRVRTLDSLAFDPMPNYNRFLSIFATDSFKQMRTEVLLREKKAAERQDAEREVANGQNAEVRKLNLSLPSFTTPG